MSELIHDKAIEEILQKLVGEPGKIQPFAQKLMDSYKADLLAEAQLLLKSGKKVEDIAEHYIQELKGDTMNKIVNAFTKSSEFNDSLYKKSYEMLKALGDGSKSYGDLFTEIYEDETYLNEIFVRLVEEAEGVAITSAKQLQELTGITEIYGYWDEEKGETVPYGDKKPTKKEAQEIAFKQVEDTFIKAMSYRYSKALEDILEAGGKYSDLLQVKPSFFNLPETWSGCLGSDQYSSILWALSFEFLISEPVSLMLLPDLRSIAQEVKAPYSVLMDCYNLTNKGKKYGATGD
jgi:hypothetical protein